MDDFSPIVVLRTGKVYEFDLVLNQLDSEGIPTFTQNQTSSGMRLATPATLTGDAGSWWTIGVPEEYEDQAKEIILELGFGEKTDPEVLDFANPELRKNMRIFYAALLGIVICIFGYLFIGTIIGYLK
jgi:hypothetical protein